MSDVYLKLVGFMLVAIVLGYYILMCVVRWCYKREMAKGDINGD
jgi:hypothetical protein